MGLVNDGARVRATETLATALLRRAVVDTRPAERRHARRLGRLLADPAGRELLFALTDEVVRAEDDHRAMHRLDALVRDGVPPSLGPIDRLGMHLAAAGGRVLPSLVARAVRARVRNETRGVILPARDPAFARHLAGRRAEGVDANINLLGEAILGDDEADRRLDAVCTRIRRPDVQCVSVKISALCANLDVLAWDDSLARIVQRLRTVYRVAAATDPPTFVYLDMEEYRDLHLTVVAFRTVLDEPEFAALTGGI